MRSTRIMVMLGMCLLLSVTVSAKGTLQGAWSRISLSPAGELVKEVLLFSGDYFAWTTFADDGGIFIDTKGGSFTMQSGALNLTYEFHSSDSVKVGTTESWSWWSGDDGLGLALGDVKKEGWKALESGETSSLSGVWLMAGRVRDGQESRRDINVPRKTMKILTGTRFQWIAYNTATKQFLGTGGGTYAAKEGKYTENLEFFSRDNNRVGMSLEFNFDASSGDWHHTGKSSAGEPMHEIWVRRME